MATDYPSNAYQFRDMGGVSEALEELGGTVVDEAGVAGDGTDRPGWVWYVFPDGSHAEYFSEGWNGAPEDNVIVGEVGDRVVVVTPPPHRFQPERS